MVLPAAKADQPRGAPGPGKVAASGSAPWAGAGGALRVVRAPDTPEGRVRLNDIGDDAYVRGKSRVRVGPVVGVVSLVVVAGLAGWGVVRRTLPDRTYLVFDHVTLAQAAEDMSHRTAARFSVSDRTLVQVRVTGECVLGAAESA